MAHSFVWWAVIWLLEIYCRSQDIKTFQSHLGAVSQICSWWKQVQFQRYWWFVDCLELFIRKAGTVNSSFIQYKKCALFKRLKKFSPFSMRLIRSIGPELILNWESKFSPSPSTRAHKSGCFSHQGLGLLGCLAKAKQRNAQVCHTGLGGKVNPFRSFS